MANRSLLLSCLSQDTHLQQQFAQLNSPQSSSVDVIRVNDVQKLIDFFHTKTDAPKAEKHPLPNIIILLIELNNPITFDLLENLQIFAKSRGIPKIIISQTVDKPLVKKAYNFGVTSVVRYKPDAGSMSALMNRIYHYWFNSVELPKFSA